MRKRFIFMEQNAADSESVPIVWHFAVKKSLPHCLIFVGLRNFGSLLFKKISVVFVAKDIMEQPVSLSNGIPLLLCFANEQ